MRKSVFAISLLLFGVLTASCSESIQAEAAPMEVEVGQVYEIVSVIIHDKFKILEIGKGRLVKVQVVEDAQTAQLLNGIWWLNLDQVLLFRAIK